VNKILLNDQIPFVDKLYAMYPFGSRVYGNIHEASDWDYLLILKKPAPVQQLIKGQLSFTIQTKDSFQQALDQHESIALECYFLPPTKVDFKPIVPWIFQLNKDKLKSAYDNKITECFLKAEKKINSENLLVGKKVLFHAIRVALFGIQMLKNGKITNYKEANEIWKSIINNESVSWEDYENTYKPIYLKVRNWFLNSKLNENISTLIRMLPVEEPIKMRRRTYQDSK